LLVGWRDIPGSPSLSLARERAAIQTLVPPSSTDPPFHLEFFVIARLSSFFVLSFRLHHKLGACEARTSVFQLTVYSKPTAYNETVPRYPSLSTKPEANAKVANSESEEQQRHRTKSD